MTADNYAPITKPLSDLEGYALLRRKFFSSSRRQFLRLNGAVLSIHSSPAAPVDWDVSLLNTTLIHSSRRASLVIAFPTGSKLYLHLEDRVRHSHWVATLQAAARRDFASYYILRDKIGEGAFASVHRAVSKASGAIVAVKCIKKNQFDAVTARELDREMFAMRHLRHSHVVTAHDVFNTQHDVFIVMDFMAGGTLKDNVQSVGGRIPEKYARPIMRQVLHACRFLHSHGYVHRDIKLENVLCDAKHFPVNRVRIADFGYVNFVDDARNPCLRSLLGTPVYIAPEIINRQPYGAPVDIYAAGVMLYRMLSGHYPYDGREDDDKTMSLAVEARLTFPDSVWKRVSPDCLSFVRALLQSRPERRLTAETALLHPWFDEKVSRRSDGTGPPSPVTPEPTAPPTPATMTNVDGDDMARAPPPQLASTPLQAAFGDARIMSDVGILSPLTPDNSRGTWRETRASGTIGSIRSMVKRMSSEVGRVRRGSMSGGMNSENIMNGSGNGGTGARVFRTWQVANGRGSSHARKDGEDRLESRALPPGHDVEKRRQETWDVQNKEAETKEREEVKMKMSEEKIGVTSNEMKVVQNGSMNKMDGKLRRAAMMVIFVCKLSILSGVKRARLRKLAIMNGVVEAKGAVVGIDGKDGGGKNGKTNGKTLPPRRRATPTVTGTETVVSTDVSVLVGGLGREGQRETSEMRGTAMQMTNGGRKEERSGDGGEGGRESRGRGSRGRGSRGESRGRTFGRDSRRSSLGKLTGRFRRATSFSRADHSWKLGLFGERLRRTMSIGRR